MVHDILTRVQELDDRFRKAGSATWYRGHRRSEWALKSTLHRYVERLTAGIDMASEELRQLLRDESKTRYRQFKQEAWPLLGPAERSEWGVIFTMQHYRLPTRLLDWTESFLCALFFAQQHRDPKDAAAVWVLDSAALNEISVGAGGLIALDENVGDSTFDARGWHPRWVPPSEDLRTIAVSPIFTNARMTAQRAAFTLAGDSFLALEEQLDRRLIREGRLVKIELPPEGFDEVEDYLRVAGVRAFTYFPDLEGLALDHERHIATMLRETPKFFPDLGKRRP
jgi:hypothetical protein